MKTFESTDEILLRRSRLRRLQRSVTNGLKWSEAMAKKTAAKPKTPGDKYEFVWHWHKKHGDRHGQRCRILTRGKKNSILVEFEDGFRTVTSGYAIRRPTQKKSRQNLKEHTAWTMTKLAFGREKDGQK